MIAQTVRTYLEMTRRDQLRASRPCPSVRLEPIGKDTPLLRELVRQVGVAYHWPELSDSQWAQTIASPALAHWVVVIDAAAGGVVEMQTQPHGAVEIRVFGLLPERIGRGYGGPALTHAVQLAWARPPVDEHPIHRVWLHTSSLDHPHALPNYLHRGFRPYRVERLPTHIG